MAKKKIAKVLFVCIGNSGRSQMAEGYFNYLARGKAVAISAGTRPASHVDPTVIALMLESGIDISHKQPKQLVPEMMDDVDRIITMGCGVGEVCPSSFITTEDWELDDPKGKPVKYVRQIRDAIISNVAALIEELG